MVGEGGLDVGRGDEHALGRGQRRREVGRVALRGGVEGAGRQRLAGLRRRQLRYAVGLRGEVERGVGMLGHDVDLGLGVQLARGVRVGRGPIRVRHGVRRRVLGLVRGLRVRVLVLHRERERVGPQGERRRVVDGVGVAAEAEAPADRLPRRRLDLHPRRHARVGLHLHHVDWASAPAAGAVAAGGGAPGRAAGGRAARERRRPDGGAAGRHLRHHDGPRRERRQQLCGRHEARVSARTVAVTRREKKRRGR